MVDAEIRRLTYVQRYADSARTKDANMPASLAAELPFLRRQESPRPVPSVTDLRMEARIAELEREKAEAEQGLREQMAAMEQGFAVQLEAAVREQAERTEAAASISIRNAVAAFSRAREEYFAAAEAAVVRLALSIAARVLHREAQVDPLMLRGPVRVALEQLPQNTACELEVAESMAESWSAWIAKGVAPGASITVRGRAGASLDHCRLEAGPSSADFSVPAQLAEIERGFFDLLAQRTAKLHSPAPGIAQ